MLPNGREKGGVVGISLPTNPEYRTCKLQSRESTGCTLQAVSCKLLDARPPVVSNQRTDTGGYIRPRNVLSALGGLQPRQQQVGEVASGGAESSGLSEVELEYLAPNQYPHEAS